jgi:HprK-related kinase A
LKEVKENLPICSTILGGEAREFKSTDFPSPYRGFIDSPSSAHAGEFNLRNRTSPSLHSHDICFRIGPYWCRVRSHSSELLKTLVDLYQDCNLQSGLPAGIVADIDVEVCKLSAMPWAEPQVEFRWKGYSPLPSLPLSQIHPLFEWGLNWCMATLLGTEIVIHAAILERNGMAMTLPGEPGAGKSTLCSALALSGWRLLSDELTVIRIATGLAVPLPRPISLKDRAIEIIARRHPEAQMTVPVQETRKGSIAYVRPPSVSVRDSLKMVPIGSILYPQYMEGAAFSIEPLTAAASLSRLLSGTFNVGLLGHQGFSRLASVVGAARSHAMQYGDLDAALGWIETNCP